MSIVALGIDIAKADFKAAIRVNGKVKRKTCANSQQGFAELAGWLSRQGVDKVHACIEHTGQYGEALALFLAEAGHTVSMVNPATVKAFAKSTLSRNKNDEVDAAILAHYCEVLVPQPWLPPAPEVRELRDLMRRLEDLEKLERIECNHASAGKAAAEVERSISATIEHLQSEIQKVKKAIASLFDDHPDLKAKRDLLETIPGIGEKTATALLAEIPDIARFKSARELAAFIGVSPRQHSSGQNAGRTRLSKTGSRRLRKALYFPAIVAIQSNPTVRDLRDRLAAKGKAKMAIIGAAMRKLVHIVFGVLRTQRPYRAHATAL